jgi:hypothetical protein
MNFRDAHIPEKGCPAAVSDHVLHTWNILQNHNSVAPTNASKIRTIVDDERFTLC